MEVAPTLGAKTGDKELNLVQDAVVRKLMPLECERLQGFPDNWTKISWRENSRRMSRRIAVQGYRQQHGCSCMRYLADRIEFVMRSEVVS